MASEVVVGLILLAMAFVLRGLMIMIDRGTFDRFVYRLNNYIDLRNKRKNRKDI